MSPAARRIGALVVVGLCGAVIGAVAMAARTPQEVADQRAAPDPVPATAEVTRQVLRDVRTGTCDLAPAGVRDVAAPAAGDGAQAVVTAVAVAPGDPLTGGQRVVEISGRPLIALALPFPLYRTITPGAEGNDVAAVQGALRGLGLLGDAGDGRYDRATQEAVDQLYQRAGAVAPRTGPEQDQALAAAQARLQAAEQAVAGGAPGATGEREEAAAAVATARAAIGVIVTPAEVLAVAAGTVVHETPAPVGTVVGPETPVLRTRTPGVTATCRFPGQALDGVTGTPAATLGVADGRQVDGTLAGLRTDETGGTVADFAAHPDPVPADAAGQTATVEVVAAETAAEVVTVPVGALRDRPDGGVEVEVLGRATAPTPVPVEVGVVAGGWAEVRAGDLEPGEQVVVGAVGVAGGAGTLDDPLGGVGG